MDWGLLMDMHLAHRITSSWNNYYSSRAKGLAKTVSVDITSEGKYVFQDLNPGKYTIVAYFPDGEYRVLNNIEVVPNSVQTLIFKY